MSKTYRVIVIFDAADGATAKREATKAAQLVKGKIDRLTERRETWGEVQDDSAES